MATNWKEILRSIIPGADILPRSEEERRLGQKAAGSGLLESGILYNPGRVGSLVYGLEQQLVAMGYGSYVNQGRAAARAGRPLPSFRPPSVASQAPAPRAPSAPSAPRPPSGPRRSGRAI